MSAAVNNATSAAIKNGAKKSGSAPAAKTKAVKGNSSAPGNGGNGKNKKSASVADESAEAPSSSADGKGNDATSSGGGGIFRPFVVLALPGVNLFRRFSQYRRLPQEPPPKDKLEVELDRLNSKIVSKMRTP